jgi:glucokinase
MMVPRGKHMSEYWMGVDIGGTFIKAGLIGPDGLVIVSEAPFPAGPSEKTAETIFGMLKDLCHKGHIDIDDVQGIGAGSPGIVDSATGNVFFASNLGWKNAKLANEIFKATGKKTVILNDANAAAYGEYVYGSRRAFSSMVFLTIGTGVGSGVISNGVLLEGYRGTGTELGHMSININGDACKCGRSGCFEEYVSTTALLKEATEAMVRHSESRLWSLAPTGKIDGKIFFQAVREKDKIACEVLDKYMKYLAFGLGNIINAFGPEAIVIGGGISEAKDYFLNPLKEAMASQVWLGKGIVDLKIQCSALGNTAGFLGAAAYAKEHLADKQ